MTGIFTLSYMPTTAPFENRRPVSRTRRIPVAHPLARDTSLREDVVTASPDEASIRHSTIPESRRPVHYQVTFAPHVLPKRMLYVVLGLLSAHLILAVFHFQVHKLPWLLRQLFDLDQENNIPSWYSGTALFVTAVFIWLCARQKKALEDPWTRQWYILTFAFFFLAIDEIAGLHETFNTLININWAIPGGLLACAMGLMLTPFLMQLHQKTAALFAISGLVYFGGAVGMELLALPLNPNSLRYFMMTLWEEGLEMLGVVLFLYALLAYMSGNAQNRVQVAAGLEPTFDQ